MNDLPAFPLSDDVKRYQQHQQQQYYGQPGPSQPQYYNNQQQPQQPPQQPYYGQQQPQQQPQVPQQSPYAGYAQPQQYQQPPPQQPYNPVPQQQPPPQQQQPYMNPGAGGYGLGYAPAVSPQPMGGPKPVPQPQFYQQPQQQGAPNMGGYNMNPGQPTYNPIQRPLTAGPARSNSMSNSEKLRKIFNGVDKDKNGRLTEEELQSALINGDYTKFNADTVRLMVKMFDRDHDNAIDFQEFDYLWRYLAEWRKIFARFDTDRSDTISLEEYVTALQEFGYTLSPKFTQNLFRQYAHVSKTRESIMSFDMFVQSCINLKRMTEVFRVRDVQRTGMITLTFEDFLIAVMELR